MRSLSSLKLKIIMNNLKKAQIVSEEFCNKAIAELAVQRKMIVLSGRHREVFEKGERDQVFNHKE